MKKKAIGNRTRELILFIERILVVILAVSLTLVFMNSFLTISTSYGTNYHYHLSLEEQDLSFEDKSLFSALFKGNMEQITRYVVIRHQLETDGKYDTHKQIDITEYANRSGRIVGEEATARYYLDDLVKWGNYGFTYNTVIGTWDELNQLFAENKAIYTEETLPGVEPFPDASQEEAIRLGLEPKEDDQYAMEILVPRYKTVEGKDLMECASSVEEYEKLKSNLILSAKSLFANYTEYVNMQKEYTAGNTNIGYCFQIQTDKGLIYYTNSDMSFSHKTVDDITAYVKQLGGEFIYFNPDKVQINTNTEFTAAQLRTMLKEYEYSFGDNTRVWFWIDSDYPVQDDFFRAKELLDRFMPYYGKILLLSCMVLLLVVWDILFLSFKEGRTLDEEGQLSYKLLKQDAFPLEVWAILIIIPQFFLVSVAGNLLGNYKAGTISYNWLPLVMGIIGFVINECTIRFYFSLLRRIKSRQVWKTSLLRWIGVSMKTFAEKVYDNGSVVTRTWIPYLIFLMLNLILVLLGIGGVAGAFLLDMLVGVYLYRDYKAREEIIRGIELIKGGKVKHRIDTTHLHGENLKLAVSVNSIGSGIHKAVETSMKDEKLKTDLITNVSHDIKTPLTSIITYVDLLKRENISDHKVASYLEVLDNKSQRLKQLIDDLVDASKISSGNIQIQLETINFVELVRQALGEFDEKFEDRQLQVVTRLPEHQVFIEADSSQLWRVLENLFVNVSKYALKGTRVYIEMEERGENKEKKIFFSVKNISARFLEVQAEDLTERFIRGDRSRQTEGSGLGLSIAKNLIEIQDGEFEIQVDGDLFKAIIAFPVI